MDVDTKLADRVSSRVGDTNERLTERAGELRGGVTSRWDELRDRAAGAVSSDDDRFARELGRVKDRFDDAEDRLREGIERVEDRVRDQFERLSGQLMERWEDVDDRWGLVTSDTRRTTWPRRIFWLTLGALAGAAAAYFADPDRGRHRRQQVTDRAGARGRDVAGEVTQKADHLTGQAKGAVMETARRTGGEDVPSDPKLLQQRIQSEVFGHRDDVTEVVIRVDAPGEVALKGTVPSAESESSLLAQVAEVEGVTDVRSELAIAST